MIGIGPANTAGQAYRLAVALRQQGIPAESWSPHPHRLGFPVDRVGRMGSYSRVISWTGARIKHPCVADAFQGSELRDPLLHRQLEPWSPFGDDDFTAELVRRLRRPRIGITTFVATLEMLDYAPGAAWLPIIADATEPRPLFARKRPLVLHSATNAVLKGSRYVYPDSAYDLRRPRFVLQADFLQAVADADIIIGGLVLGDYGGTEIQGLAAGRIVVGNVSERVRSKMPVPVPIVQADPSTITDVLRDIAAHPDDYVHLSEEGRAFHARFHDGRYSVEQLGGFLR